jgi:hypothetical protein
MGPKKAKAKLLATSPASLAANEAARDPARMVRRENVDDGDPHLLLGLAEEPIIDLGAISLDGGNPAGALVEVELESSSLKI